MERRKILAALAGGSLTALAGGSLTALADWPGQAGAAVDTTSSTSSSNTVNQFAADEAPTYLSLNTGPCGHRCEGVTISPEDDAAAVVANHPSGTDFCFTEGIHRLAEPVRPKPGQRFFGRAEAILSGSTVVEDFEYDGEYWIADGLETFYLHGECEGDSEACRHAEMVHFNGQPLRQVLDRADLAPGRFFADHDTEQIVLADDPTDQYVELSVTQNAFAGREFDWQHESDDVTVSNLTVEQFASQAQQGAIASLDSQNWTVEHVEARRNHGVGITVATGGVIRNCHSHHNGQLGLGGTGEDVLIEGNEVHTNNTLGFDDGWEAGGLKFGDCDGLTVRDNLIRDNGGPGFWTDVYCINVLVEGNIIADNRNAGIFHEISYDATFRHNRVVGNAWAGNVWAYGAGIQIAHSPNVDVVGNYVEGNYNGITVIMQERGDGPYGELKPRNVTVAENDVRMDQGFTGAVQDIDDKSLFTDRDIEFTGNRYDVDPDADRFAWDDKLMTISEWREYGNE